MGTTILLGLRFTLALECCLWRCRRIAGIVSKRRAIRGTNNASSFHPSPWKYGGTTDAHFSWTRSDFSAIG